MKPIVLTEEIIRNTLAEFETELRKTRMSDGRFRFERNFSFDRKGEEKVQVIFTPEAYLKMTELIRYYKSEVGWHGVVSRVSSTEFVIEDILVYPQTVTGATVDTNQEAYQQWLLELDDDTVNQVRMQGHSHVDMAVTPSSTDRELYSTLLRQIGKNDYYIFMIFNKRMERTVIIYDLANNIEYGTDDIDISVCSDEFDLDEFMENADEMVQKHTPLSTATAMKTQAQIVGGGSDDEEDDDADEYDEAEDDFDEDEYRYPPGFSGYYAGHNYCGSGVRGQVVDYDDMIFGGNRYR